MLIQALLTETIKNHGSTAQKYSLLRNFKNVIHTHNLQSSLRHLSLLMGSKFYQESVVFCVVVIETHEQKKS